MASSPTAEDLERVIESLGTHGGSTSFGMLTGEGQSMTVLTVSDPTVMQAAAADRPDAWRSLDVAVLQTLILDPLLPTHHERDASITYSRDSVESVQAVRRGDCQVTFLMGCPTVEQMAAVADAGSRMPEKSTYFYPKVPTGLVMRRID